MPAQEPELRDALEAALRESAVLNDEPRRADRAGRPGQRGPSVDHVVTCAACGTIAEDGSRFCEQCGTPLGAARRPRTRGRGGPSRSEPARLPVVPARCGGTIATDGYCESCGEPAVSERDHWSELPSALVGGVCDRGRRKTRNEDAMALGAQRSDRRPRGLRRGVERAGLRRREPHRGARRAGRPGHGAGGQHGRRVVGAPGHRPRLRPTRRIADAVGDTTDRAEPPSCTFVAAVVDGPTVVAGWLGDSRVYWLPDEGAAHAGQRRRLRGERDDRARRAAGQGGGVAARGTRSPGGSAPTPRPCVPGTGTTPGAGTRLGARLLGRPVELLLRGHRRRRPAAPHHRAGGNRRPTSSPPSWSGGRTSRAGTTTSPRRWPASRHPSILSTPTRPSPADPAPTAALIEEPQWPTSAPRCSRTSSSPTVPRTCTRSSR